jgi:tetratricopeptide (TPR) repeat protein
MKVLIRIGALVLMVLFLTADLGIGQKNAEQIYEKGVEYAAQGNFHEAKEKFEKALKVDPYYEPSKRALKVIEDAFDQKLKSAAAIHLFKGISYGENEQWDESITEFNNIIKITSRYAYAYYCRGIAYAKGKGQYDKAISDYTKAIKIAPGFAVAYYNRGLAYARGKGQYDKAIFNFTKAIKLNPDDAYTFYFRGYSYVKKGQHDKAISDFTKAIELTQFSIRHTTIGGLPIIKEASMTGQSLIITRQ